MSAEPSGRRGFLPADAALEFPPSFPAAVLPQRRRAGKRRAAPRASLRLPPGVAEEVNLEQPAEQKTPPALGTFVGIFPGVVGAVEQQPVRAVESQSALGAAVGEFSEVHLEVLAEGGVLGEAFVALGTLVGTLAGVGEVVAEEVGVGVEGFSALAARERPLARVGPRVVAEVRRFFKHFPAGAAAVPPLQAVHESLVSRQSAGIRERFGTHSAFQRGFGGLWGVRDRWNSAGIAVGAAVVEKFGHVDERFPAGAAVERIGAVRAAVSQKRRLGVQRRAAIQTEEPRFPRVSLEVTLQLPRVRQHPRAQRAVESAEFVTPQVRAEQAGRRQELLALVAAEFRRRRRFRGDLRGFSGS